MFTAEDIGRLYAVPPWLIDGAILKPSVWRRPFYRLAWWWRVKREDVRSS